MASTRFFWLPWPVRSDIASVVGTTSRISQHPWGVGPINGLWIFPPVGDLYPTAPYYGTGNYSNIGRAWYDYQGAGSMSAYAVTTNPAQVPLTSARITVQNSWNSGDTYPRQPRYQMWNGSWTSSVYLEDSTSKPDTLVDVTGPFYSGSQCLRPAFFSVLETIGVTSIGKNEFIQTGEAWPFPTPRAMYIRQRVEPGTDVMFVGGSDPYRKFVQSGVAPFLAYVLRPSTGAIVGWLYTMYNLGGYGPRGLGGAAINGQTGVLPGPTEAHALTNLSTNYQSNCRWDVTGIQDHDLIVWEWWTQATIGAGAGQQYPTMGPGPWDTATSTEFCGGLSGQPLTYDGGLAVGSIPDWAPSQGSPIVINGIDPPLPIETPRFAGLCELFSGAGDIHFAQAAKLTPPDIRLPFLGGTHFVPDYSNPGVYSNSIHVGGARLSGIVRFNPPNWTTNFRRFAGTANIAGVVERFAQQAILIPSGTKRMAGTATFLANQQPRFAGTAAIGFTVVTRVAGESAFEAVSSTIFAQTATLNVPEERIASTVDFTYARSERFASDESLWYAWRIRFAGTAELTGGGEPRLAGTADICHFDQDSFASDVSFQYVQNPRLAGLSTLLKAIGARFAQNSTLTPEEITVRERFSQNATLTHYGVSRVAGLVTFMPQVTRRLAGTASFTYLLDERFASDVAFAQTSIGQLAHTVRLQPTAIRLFAGTAQLVGDRFASTSTFDTNAVEAIAGFATLTLAIDTRLSQLATLSHVRIYRIAQLASFSVDPRLAQAARLQNAAITQIAQYALLNAPAYDAIAQAALLSPTASIAQTALLSPTASIAQTATFRTLPRFACLVTFNKIVEPRLASTALLTRYGLFAGIADFTPLPRFAGISTLHIDNIAQLATLSFARRQAFAQTADIDYEIYNSCAGTAQLVEPRLACEATLDAPAYAQFACDATLKIWSMRLAGYAGMTYGDVSILSEIAELEASVYERFAAWANFNAPSSHLFAQTSYLEAYISYRFASNAVLTITIDERSAASSSLEALTSDRLACSVAFESTIMARYAQFATLQDPSITLTMRLASDAVLVDNIVTSGLLLNLDAGNAASYSGTGNTWYDLSGAGRDMVLTNTSYSSANGGSIAYTGTGAFSNGTTGLATGNPAQTVELWIKSTAWPAVNAWPVLIGQNSAGGEHIIQGNGYYYMGEYGGNSVAAYIGLDEWRQIVLTGSGAGSIAGYNNTGGLTAVAGTFALTSSTIMMGYNQANQWFIGNVAIVRIYNRVLSADEVTQNFNAVCNRYSMAMNSSRLAQTAAFAYAISGGLAGTATLAITSTARFSQTATLVDWALNLYLDGVLSSYNGTTWTDVSGRGHNATLSGTTYDPVYGGIAFPGSGTTFSAPHPIDGGNENTGITIDIWWKANTITDFEPYVYIGSKLTWWLQDSASGSIQTSVGNAQKITTPAGYSVAGAIENWTFTFWYNPSTFSRENSLYKNGVNVWGLGGNNYAADFAASFIVDAGTNATIYEISAYKRKLSAAEIAANYTTVYNRHQFGATWTSARMSGTATLNANVATRFSSTATLGITGVSRLSQTSQLWTTVIPYDASSYSHVAVRSGALIDLMGRSWTKSGFPTFLASASLGFIKPVAAEAVQGFTDAAHYFTNGGAGASPWDLANGEDLIITFVMWGNYGSPLGHGTSSTGYFFGPASAVLYGTTRTATTPANQTVPYVMSFGFSGNTWYWKTNQTTVVQGTLGTIGGVSSATYLGRAAQGGLAWNRGMYEMRFIKTACSVDILNNLHNTIMGVYTQTPRFAQTATLNAVDTPKFAQTATLYQYQLIDANTNNLFRFDSVPALIDSAPGGFGTSTMNVINQLGAVSAGHLINSWDFNNLTYSYTDIQSTTAGIALKTLIQGDFTIEGWAYVPSGRTYSTPEWMLGIGDYNQVTYRSPFAAVFQSGQSLYITWLMYCGGDTQISTGLFGYDTWVHYAYRRRLVGAQWSHDTWMNGVLQNSANIGTPYFAGAYPTYFYVSPGPGFVGRLDTLRISNIWRSDQDIVDFYNNT
jgi:hypothetical protein